MPPFTTKKVIAIFWLLVIGVFLIILFTKIQKVPETYNSLPSDRLATSSMQAILFNRDFSLWLYDNKLYHSNSPCGNNFTLVDVDLNNIRFYKEYFRDTKSVWVKNWGHGEVGYCLPPIKLVLDPPVDTKTFVEIPSGAILWAKDKYGLIQDYSRVKDFSSPFETYDQPYVKKDGVFYYLTNLVEMEIDPINNLPNDINKFLSIHYAINDSGVYYIDPYSTQTATEVVGANPKNFKNLVRTYWTDGNSIYYEYIKLIDANPNNFHYIGNEYYGDEKHIYVNEKMISNVPYTNFKLIKPDSKFESCGYNYWTDGNTVFYEGKDLKINYAKAHMTTSIWGGPGQCADIGYIWDSQRAAYHEKGLSNVDISTFRVLSGGYARDKNYFYVSGEILPGDPDMIEKDFNNGNMSKYIDYSEEDMY